MARVLQYSFDALTSEEDAKDVEAFFKDKECVPLTSMMFGNSTRLIHFVFTALPPTPSRWLKVLTLFEVAPAGCLAMPTM